MSVIRNYIEDFNLFGILNLVETMSNPLSLAREILPDKSERHEEFKRLINIHMPELYEGPFKPENLKPSDNVRSWDKYVISNPYLQGNYPREQFCQQLEKINLNFQANRITDNDLSSLKDSFSKWIEIDCVRSGVHTAFSFIFGLLRVIPILWKQKEQQHITKEGLIEILKHKKTRALLAKAMSITISALLRLQNVLWQKPVLNKKEARGNLVDYELGPLNFMDAFTKMNKLFHPGNFMLTDDGGLDFSESGDNYYDVAQEQNPEQTPKQTPEQAPEKALGCPFKFVQGGLIELFDHLERVIQLIPDEQFNQLIASNPTSYQEIIEGFNQEYAVAENKFKKLKAEFFQRNNQ